MDEALLSISPAGRGQIVKILITLEPHGIFGSNFSYLFSTLSCHWYAAAGRILNAENHKIYVNLNKMPIEIINNNNI